MVPIEPGRTLIHWHRQEKRVVSCIPPEAASGAGVTVFHPSGWLAALED
jgi:hypothetical protein